MRRIRSPAVAGTFYPADVTALRAEVRRLLEAVGGAGSDEGVRAVIVPHAGYVFSGPVAASAFAVVPSQHFRRVLLLGPSHFGLFPGLSIPSATHLRTPLGDVAVDAELRSLAAAYAGVSESAHRREHSLEVQLPFLQTILAGAPCLPVLTGDPDPTVATELLMATAGNRDVLIVISSDLSHYLDHASAQRMDGATARAIVELRPDDVGPHSACGRTAVRAGLHAARRLGWTCRLLDLRTSADTSGDPSRVVGYGAFALGPSC